jgi:hypothetical protein
MYFGSLGKTSPACDTISRKLATMFWAMVRYFAALGLISAVLMTGCGGGGTTASKTVTGGQPAQHRVELVWIPSLSTVVGYNIYRGNTPGGPYSLKLNPSPLPGTTFVDDTVLSGTTYYYVATSLNANSEESLYSNEITAVIP